MNAEVEAVAEPEQRDWSAIIWIAVTIVTFCIAAVVAYEANFESPWATANSILPAVVFIASLAFLAAPFLKLPARLQVAAAAVAFGGWAVILFDDDRWTILNFTMYAIAFSFGRFSSLWLAGFVSVVWGAVWLVNSAPLWTLVIPIGAFGVGVLMFETMLRASVRHDEQANLIQQLTEAQNELAASERAKGVLEERARVASEIHDTLAQGFTSIVLLSRAAQRGGDITDGLSAIEHTAQENLEAARRLIEAKKPSELEGRTLADALELHRATCLSPGVASTFRVVGTPRRLAGPVEVTILRAAQEALLNIETHAEAENVDITLSYLDDVIALDVRDDGVGFSPGCVADRGSLTGGQGLQALERRASSLAGELTIEAMAGGGSVVSVLLPSTGP